MFIGVDYLLIIGYNYIYVWHICVCVENLGIIVNILIIFYICDITIVYVYCKLTSGYKTLVVFFRQDSQLFQ